MNKAKKRIHSVILQLSAIQGLFLIVLFFLSIHFLEINKEKIAEAVSMATRESLLNGDNRTAIIYSDQISKDDFVFYQYDKKGQDKLFTNPHNISTDEIKQFQEQSYQYGVISKKLRFGVNGAEIGTYTFVYDRFEYLKYVLVTWFVLTLFLIPFGLRAIRKVSEDIERDVELEKEKFFGESAKNWAHDIKQLTEPMRTILEGIQIKSSEERKILFQSLSKIEQRTLGILGKKEQFYEKLEDFSDTSKSSEPISAQKELLDFVKELKALYHKYESVELNCDLEGLEQVFTTLSLTDFKRAMENIVSNSIDAFDLNKQNIINITGRFDGNILSIEVSDTGRGIPQEILSNIFDESFSHGKEKGTGRGLHQVKKFIDDSKGSINVDSDHTGTTIRIKLPATKLNLNEIIHIDDEVLLRKIWKRYFSKRGVKVHSYSSPSEFISKNDDLSYELPVFIDSYMGEEELGEVFAKKLEDKGFKTIYLASGDTSHVKLEDFPWLRGSIGKSAKNALSVISRI